MSAWISICSYKRSVTNAFVLYLDTLFKWCCYSSFVRRIKDQPLRNNLRTFVYWAGVLDSINDLFQRMDDYFVHRYVHSIWQTLLFQLITVQIEKHLSFFADNKKILACRCIFFADNKKSSLYPMVYNAKYITNKVMEVSSHCQFI